ncbi:ankyrin repeat domain-containing protein [Rickettsia hoogstraalii]|uniref:ankyrin repeat domain-containing protein n=1 Tax=Rickettsia hoogstraalii TaxID=467174 RepID=UPI000AD73341|nr:ankyrin repeat domain-containing protein [Rickettsia hoogstraalii]
MSKEAINQINNIGYTALSVAVSQSLEKVCELLIPKMSDYAINHVIEYSNITTLILAIHRGLEKVCQLLISKMTDHAINHVNNQGETALSLATKNGFKNICDLLMNKLDNIQEENIYSLLVEMINKLGNASNIRENEKDIIQNNILNKIKKLEENNINLENIVKSMQNIIKSNKITKGMLMDLEEEIDEIMQQQTVTDNHICIDKLNIFQQIVAEINIKLQKDNTIATSNKSEMQNTINIIMKKVPTLTNVSDIEKITAIMKELTTGRITKGKLIDIEEEVEELILQHLNKEMNKITTWAVKEIIYDKPLLNHTKLLQAAVDSKLSSDLIYEAN